MARYIIFDIETWGDEPLANKTGLFNNVEAPSNYKDPAKIEAYKEAQRMKIKEKLALKPMYASIQLITIIIDGQEPIVLENPKHSRVKEKAIIEQLVLMLQKTPHEGRKGIGTCEIVTFNGKRYDFPLLIQRSLVTGASVPIRWLDKLTGYGDRNGHFDMCDVLEGSLDLNLRAAGMEGKKRINHNSRTHEQLKEYAVDEIKQTEILYKRMMGYD